MRHETRRSGPQEVARGSRADPRESNDGQRDGCVGRRPMGTRAVDLCRRKVSGIVITRAEAPGARV